MTEITRDMVRANKANQANKSALRAVVIDIGKRLENADRASKSKALDEDPFTALTDQGRIIKPPFDLLTLAMLPEHNTELIPCIDAMAINCEGFGHRFVPRKHVKDAEGELQAAVVKEKTNLKNWFNYASIDDSFTTLRSKVRKDLEATGNGYWELTRNIAGRPQGLTHIPSYQMRVGRIDQDPVMVDVPVAEYQEDDSVQIKEIRAWKRFRKYVQSRFHSIRGTAASGGYKVRWFKEYGDPRTYDNETGDIVPSEKVLNWDGKGGPMPEERKASEIIHFKLYSTRSAYGLPRFVGNLLSVYGDRASEEINYSTLKNNNIPSMVVLVSNGQLTQGSIERIEKFVETQIQSQDNYSKFLILEAEGDLEGEEGSQVKVELKPLTNIQHRDALFQNYSMNNQDKIRRAFRLPPIFVGKTDDYTRTTAETSRRLADEQIFAPERDEFDAWINRRLFPEMGIVFHEFRSNSPNTTDNAELVKLLAGAEKTGGMTPEIARIMLEDILGRELPNFPEDFDKEVPFSLLMAEAVKNKADPSEPGQQVTALKALEGDEGELFEATCEKCGHEGLVMGVEKADQAFADRLLGVQARLEKKWREAVAENEGHDHDEG